MLAGDKEYLETWYNLGVALDAAGQTLEALQMFDAVLAVLPSHAGATVGRGTAFRRLGRTKEARDAFEQAVALEPGNPVYHRALADAKSFRADDPQIAAMEALLHGGAVPGAGRIDLNFALGKAYDETGRHAEAFTRWKNGNLLWRGTVAYDEAAELASLAAMAEAYPAHIFETLKEAGHPSELPVFVFGMPRSGTTLVEQILASHPHVFGAGEIGNFGITATGGYGRENYAAVPREAEALRATGARYVEQLRALTPEAARIVDKQLNNFIYAGAIALALPRARMVHVRRDPLDTCLSCYAHMLTAGVPYSGDLGELGRYYRAYEKLMAHWHAVLPPGALLEIAYEDIVADLETQARRLVAFCGLEWDERCLAFHAAERQVNTASAYQVRRPIYASSIGRWRHYREWLGPLREALMAP